MSVRKVPGKTEGSLEGNHDNPVSGTHQAPSYWEPQWREAQILTKIASREKGGLGAKNNYNYCTQKQREQNDWLLWKHCKITKALLNPEIDPHTISEGETAGQHCLAFDLA